MRRESPELTVESLPRPSLVNLHVVNEYALGLLGRILPVWALVVSNHRREPWWTRRPASLRMSQEGT